MLEQERSDFMLASEVIERMMVELSREPTHGWIHAERQKAQRKTLVEAKRRIVALEAIQESTASRVLKEVIAGG